jgi:glycosyltransferase involved in cell wall biosynthesis
MIEQKVDVTIFFSCLNEEINGPKTLETIFNCQTDSKIIEVIAVDDGSKDSTFSNLNSKMNELGLNGIVLKNKKNMGIGSSFKKALKIAKGEKFLLIAGDNDCPESIIKEILRNNKKSDVVTSYWINTEMRGRLRNIISITYNSLYLLIFNIHLQYLNGPTLWPTHFLQKINIRSERFSISAEITTKCIRSGLSYSEVSGFMRTGIENSTSIKLKNLIEVVKTFATLYWEISVSSKKDFNKHGVRIID